MRTTLEIDDELLDSARALAAQQGLSTDVVVSRLLREALTERGRGTRAGEHPEGGAHDARRARAPDWPMDPQRVQRIRQSEGT